MLNRLRNLKIVRNLKNQLSPKLRWLMFANDNNDKSSSEYLKMITGIGDLKSSSDEMRLEAMVREQLKEEFPNIENMQSYELLVDAVMHNLKKKQLQATDNIDFSYKIFNLYVITRQSFCHQYNTPICGVLFNFKRVYPIEKGV